MRARMTSAAFLGAASLALIAAAPAPHPVYAVGQVWAYHTRPEDPLSLLKINKVELWSGSGTTPIYHIAIVGVHFGGSATPTIIAHLPVSRETLDSSVSGLVFSSAVFPNSTDGIAQWRDAHGGVFTIPVSEIVAIADQTTRKTLRP